MRDLFLLGMFVGTKNLKKKKNNNNKMTLCSIGTNYASCGLQFAIICLQILQKNFLPPAGYKKSHQKTKKTQKNFSPAALKNGHQKIIKIQKWSSNFIYTINDYSTRDRDLDIQASLERLHSFRAR